jgi:16S rRNA (cytidine1402-2'-O)-methyltransferase
MTSGTLYTVATPIGNLEDITLRALRVLREARWVACEDTRRTGVLLARHGIEASLLPCHEHNERAAAGRILAALARGEDVALVTDAGTPGISDPGSLVVREARAAGHPVVPVPGPSAVAAALSASGFACDTYHFAGFLPNRAAARRRLLAELRGIPGPLVFFETPHRIRESLADLLEILGDREALFAREITKLHEEFRAGTLASLARAVEEGEARGEFVVVVRGEAAEPVLPARPDPARVDALVAETGMSRDDAERQVAEVYGVSRKRKEKAH